MQVRPWLLVACLFLSPAAFAGLSIRFEPDAVAATGVTRGGSIICTTADRDDFRMQRTVSFVAPDADKDGEVRFAFPGGVRKGGVSAVVDLDTGAYTIASPGGVVEQLGFRGKQLAGNGAGQLHRLQADDTERLEMLVVRPGAGAWVHRAADGGAGDDDKVRNQKLDVDLANFEPLKGFGPAPRHFAKGDVIVVIDTLSLEVFATTVGQ